MVMIGSEKSGWLAWFARTPYRDPSVCGGNIFFNVAPCRTPALDFW
jgi:hypothetical protein